MSVSRRKKGIVVLVSIALLVRVWWWQWQAPYRTLTIFLDALQRGDIDTLYALTPEHERRYISSELIARAYKQVIKPHLLSGKTLDRIHRTSQRRFFS